MGVGLSAVTLGVGYLLWAAVVLHDPNQLLHR
jgi:hypothetical protein